MDRLEVLKTYKIYIGGKFPRTESGRYYTPQGKNGKTLANMCQSSRKDFRNAVTAARGAQAGWEARAAFNRGQILYRAAEMLEGRKAQFIAELQKQGSTARQAENEVHQSIDRLIYYAGWCDKYQQVFSAVNPVASSHFNFSVYEAVGVVTILAPEENSLIGLISTIAPAIAGGNTCVVLASESKPLCAISLAEVLNDSDLPGGVVNLLTGNRNELVGHMSKHMDVNAIVSCGDDAEEIKLLRTNAAVNMKRIYVHKNVKWMGSEAENPYLILDTCEVKTTWHPIETITASGSGY